MYIYLTKNMEPKKKAT